jgi:hypothetical protein
VLLLILLLLFTIMLSFGVFLMLMSSIEILDRGWVKLLVCLSAFVLILIPLLYVYTGFRD